MSSRFLFLKSSVRTTQLKLCKLGKETRRNGERQEKTDYGGFFVIQIPVPEKWKIPIG